MAARMKNFFFNLFLILFVWTCIPLTSKGASLPERRPIAAPPSTLEIAVEDKMNSLLADSQQELKTIIKVKRVNNTPRLRCTGAIKTPEGPVCFCGLELKVNHGPHFQNFTYVVCDSVSFKLNFQGQPSSLYSYRSFYECFELALKSRHD